MTEALVSPPPAAPLSARQQMWSHHSLLFPRVLPIARALLSCWGASRTYVSVRCVSSHMHVDCVFLTLFPTPPCSLSPHPCGQPGNVQKHLSGHQHVRSERLTRPLWPLHPALPLFTVCCIPPSLPWASPSLFLTTALRKSPAAPAKISPCPDNSRSQADPAGPEQPCHLRHPCQVVAQRAVRSAEGAHKHTHTGSPGLLSWRKNQPRRMVLSQGEGSGGQIQTIIPRKKPLFDF